MIGSGSLICMVGLFICRVGLFKRGVFFLIAYFGKKIDRVRGPVVGVLLFLSGLLIQGCSFDLDDRLEKLRLEAAANDKAGQAFLKSNLMKDGVHRTESGLQYKILKEGGGNKPGADDVVKVHYRGTLIDGTQFDSSYDRGEAAVFPVSRLIPGWTEALQLMKEGSYWQLYIPASLAYGKKSPSTAIPTNSTLIFELELISIEQ
ncbi:FKBP-type peptidyl-prolyl cis-trans isomerase [Motiliproteus sp. MSK22-1]|uniref:FKBP-type peptidyl-prolyl cis-trans isomerase n=1 Tax=Motiliproteus sp. MSK22-1 TaxID=1897630 RepID=UPI0018E981B6|nr:FKBP-type peptidyl-prolyl cis-trans isomerase [Motiliproteus sp. MSK22-1]